MSPIDPTIAALAGVGLTATLQILLARFQRRHDRTTKLFETRLDLYSQLAAALHRIQKTTARRAEVEKELREAQSKVSDLDSRNEELVERFRVFNEGRQGSLSEVELAEAKHILALKDEYESGRKDGLEQLATSLESLKKGQAELMELREEVSESRRHLKEIGARIAIVAEEGVRHQLSQAAQRITITGTLGPKDVEAFERAARRELGAPRACLKGQWNRAKRWIFARRLRRDVDGPRIV